MNEGLIRRAPSHRAIAAGYALIALCGALMLARGFFGAIWYDESFYVSTTDRLFRGDLLIVNEWHPTQWFTVFLLPVYALYHTVKGSPDGVLLFFRILYALFSTGVALTVYRVFYPYKGVWPVLAGALINLFFAVGFLGTFSYNTMSTNFLVLSTAGLYLYAKGRGRRLLPFLTGAAFAVAAGSHPYLAALYFAGLLLALLTRAGKRWRGFLLYGTLGIAAVALPYLAFVLRGGNLSEVLNCLKYVFQDPEHVVRGPRAQAVLYVKRVLAAYGATIFPCAAIDLYIIAKRLLRKSIGGVEGRVLLLAGALACLAQLGIAGVDKMGAAQYSLALLGLQAFLMTARPDAAMFACAFLPGFAYSVAIYLSTNIVNMGFSLGTVAMAVASSCLLWDCVRALEPPKPDWLTRAAKGSAALALIVAVGAVGAARVMAVSRDAPVQQLTARLEGGPGDGLYTLPETAKKYQDVLDVMQTYASGEGNLFVTRLMPWTYLASHMRCGAPTTWRLRFNDERMAAYQAMFEDRRLDLVVSLKPAYDPAARAWRLGEDLVGPDEVNAALIEYARENDMERIDTKCAVLFRRRAQQPGSS